MSKRFPILHNTDDASLRASALDAGQTYGDRQLTSVWCFLSSSILSVVTFRSSWLSTLLAIVLILILAKMAVKSALKLNESVVLMSREGGCFLITLNFAHASDCKFR